MRLGALSTFDVYPRAEGGSEPTRWNSNLDLVQFAESEGFQSFWVTEHHFVSSGVLPAPPVWLAAAAQRTSRIRLGALVAVLPLHDPRELAEQYALADVLSGGRLEIGVGSGYNGDEFRGFGRDPRLRVAATDVALPEFLHALRGDPLSSPGSRNGSVRLNVRPIQRPHPPIWRAAGRRSSPAAVARAGHRLALIPYASIPNLEDLRAWVEDYRRASPVPAACRVLVAMHFYVGPKRRMAVAALQRFLDTRPVVFEQETAPDGRPGSVTPGATEVCRAHLAAIGTPGVAEATIRTLVEIGVTDVAGIFDFGGLPPEDVWASMHRWVRIARSVTKLDGRESSATPEPFALVARARPIPTFGHR